MNKLDIKIMRVNDKAILPAYQTEYAAGMDLHACLDQPIVIKPFERMMIPTGLKVEIPIGYEVQIRARSGIGLKYGVTMVNGVGTIDSDYRGEMHVLLINLSNEDFTVEPNMRIAQMVLAQYERVNWLETDSLSETQRGSGGFGSTGA